MTVIGWIQILFYCAIIVAILPVLGGYMTRVFTGERTFLSPVLGPVERVFYRLSGVDERSDQNWLTYAVSMLLFSLVGFLSLYALMRFQALLPFNPAGQSTVEQGVAFNTSMSFTTNTNWQSYVPETTMSYLVQMAGLTVHNFVSAAAGIVLAVALVRGFATASEAASRQYLRQSSQFHGHDKVQSSTAPRSVARATDAAFRSSTSSHGRGAAG